MRTSPDDVRIETVSLVEADLAASLVRSGEELAPRVFLSLNVEPARAPLAVEIEVGVASALVARLLGDDSPVPEALRPLSKIELAVVEFLSISLVHELNEAAAAPLLALEAVAESPPSRLTARAQGQGRGPVRDSSKAGERNMRGMIATVRFNVASISGLVRLLCGRAALDALDAAENPLFFDDRATPEKKLARYQRFTGGAALHLVVGRTELSASDLAGLESGDVVVVEHPALIWQRERIGGRVRVRAGDGHNLFLTGEAHTLDPDARDVSGREAGSDEPAQNDGAALRLELESLILEDAGATDAERLVMEDERELAGGAEESVTALDGLVLTVHVELAARRLTLEELARLRAGQLLELGCRATDPVELIAEGRRIATGELVDIEGQLGVRITRVVS
jgi:flagellar motor switch protein FliM